jgi:hypothetical protein
MRDKQHRIDACHRRIVSRARLNVDFAVTLGGRVYSLITHNFESIDSDFYGGRREFTACSALLHSLGLHLRLHQRIVGHLRGSERPLTGVSVIRWPSRIVSHQSVHRSLFGKFLAQFTWFAHGCTHTYIQKHMYINTQYPSHRGCSEYWTEHTGEMI